MRKVIVDNPRYPHTITIVRKIVSDWLEESLDDQDEMIIYEGEGRSYTDTTTTGDAKVDTNKRKCSIPVRFDKWPAADEDGMPRTPMSGDLVRVVKGNIKEEWIVRDFEPDNDRSVVYGELNRNFNEQ